MSTQLIADLKDLMPGTVAVAGEAVYEKASKMFVGATTPAAVVRPRSTQEVARVVRFVREHKVAFAIRSGGHHTIASRLSNDSLLIDLSGLATIEVLDARQGLVRVGGGALWREVAAALEPYGLGISSGDTASVGVGGLATGGGLGWMVRKYGPLVDHIRAAEVVTADGAILEANAERHADLFWAIRGGGSNFGIVTHFTLEAHPVAGVYFGSISYGLDQASKVVPGWRDAMRQAPPELTSMLTVLPSFGQGPAMISVGVCFEGTDQAAADEALAPLRALGQPMAENIKAMPYREALVEATYPAHTRVIGRNAFWPRFSDEAVQAVVKLCQDIPPILQIRHVAGAMNDQPADATAFSHRDSEILVVNPTFVRPDATEEDIYQASAAWRVIELFGDGCYLNLLSEDTGQEVAAAFPPATLQRLRRIKAHYDPDNLFRSNYNITPASK